MNGQCIARTIFHGSRAVLPGVHNRATYLKEKRLRWIRGARMSSRLSQNENRSGLRVSARPPTIFALTNDSVKRILDSAHLPCAASPNQLLSLKGQLEIARAEILKTHTLNWRGSQSTLRRSLKTLPKRLRTLVAEFEAKGSRSLRPALREASDDQHFALDAKNEQSEHLEALLDRLVVDLKSASKVVDHLVMRLAEYDAYQRQPGVYWLPFDGDDDPESARMVNLTTGLFRRFKERDFIDMPLITALVLLSRIFLALFPEAKFDAKAENSRQGRPILEDSRFESPGVRFAATALKIFDLREVFGKKTLEQYMNLTGDGLMNNKENLQKAHDLIPALW